MAFPQLLSTKIPSNRFQCDISLLLLLGFDLPACRQLLLAHGHLPDHCLELWLLSACLEPPQYIFVGLEVGFIADKLEGVHQRACRGDVGQGNSGSHEALLGSFREVRFQRGKGFRQVGLGLVVPVFESNAQGAGERYKDEREEMGSGRARISAPNRCECST